MMKVRFATSSPWLCLFMGLSFILATSLHVARADPETEGPSESECRPYIEKALKGLENVDSTDPDRIEYSSEDIVNDSVPAPGDDEPDTEAGSESTENIDLEQPADGEDSAEGDVSADLHLDEMPIETDTDEQSSTENKETSSVEDGDADETKEVKDDQTQSLEDTEETHDNNVSANSQEASAENESADSKTDEQASVETVEEAVAESTETAEAAASTEEAAESVEQASSIEKEETEEETDTTAAASIEDEIATEEAEPDTDDTKEDTKEEDADDTKENTDADDTKEDTKEETDATKEDTDDTNEEADDTKEDTKEGSIEDTGATESKEEHESAEAQDGEASVEDATAEGAPASTEEATEDTTAEDTEDAESVEDKKEVEEVVASKEEVADEEAAPEEATESTEGSEDAESAEGAPEEELVFDIEIPDELRPREHIDQLLKLDEASEQSEKILNKVAEITLKELKRLYENAIKPLEVLYKYRDLSNRHFGDSEIFSKPLVVFMGPWSGGKSSIINYLLDNEYNSTSLRTGAEPSPAYFNLLMYGDEPEVLDGTQLAADFTFSGLQKFGQGLEERLRGLKLPSELLKKINIVEIPGILEVRKQVSRMFPFNDACQWFIDRADIIFLVYDPSKLDVGPETEAILDQLKGREHQTRIVLNKADQVKPEELMRVQGALIWNISPLMSSAQPPLMYTTSLWSRPYETWAPVRLMQAQERAFLRDLRSAVDKRIENKISSARRFAVRVRNHAKMVDCYLTTYYNHKSMFGNRKMVSDAIIEHPQDYHIYEGLSTLTNISRYDLPDPDVYRDFFRLNPLYDFQQLSATCTYFRGCPINRLDVAIAYDLPELGGKHRKLLEAADAAATKTPTS